MNPVPGWVQGSAAPEEARPMFHCENTKILRLSQVKLLNEMTKTERKKHSFIIISECQGWTQYMKGGRKTDGKPQYFSSGTVSENTSPPTQSIK